MTQLDIFLILYVKFPVEICHLILQKTQNKVISNRVVHSQVVCSMPFIKPFTILHPRRRNSVYPDIYVSSYFYARNRVHPDRMLTFPNFIRNRIDGYMNSNSLDTHW